jgi:hypothetical protein
VDLAIGKKADHWEVAEHGMDESGLLRMIAELLPATIIRRIPLPGELWFRSN